MPALRESNAYRVHSHAVSAVAAVHRNEWQNHWTVHANREPSFRALPDDMHHPPRQKWWGVARAGAVAEHSDDQHATCLL
eukprot:3531980-Rhodomonas_salina.1